MARLRYLGSDSVAATWLALSAITVVTTWVLSKDAFGGDLAVLLTMACVSLKAWLVMTRFMESTSGPLLARVVFEGWAILAPLAIGVTIAFSIF